MIKRKEKIISGIICISAIILLFMLGPAEAFVLELAISNNSPVTGEIVDFMVTAKVEEGEKIPIESFILELRGRQAIDCRFYTNGSIIDDCEGIGITHISSPPFEFGYGFGYGFIEGILLYNISFDTSFYPVGRYDTKFIAIINGSEVEVSGEKLMINAPVRGACSVRAVDGLLTLNEEEFSNNKINFHVPLRGATNGQGFLVGHNRKERFLYNFRIINVIENNEQNIILRTLGKYRINNEERTSSNGVLSLDKITRKVDLRDDAFSVSDMNVNFIRGC